jgi:hypothetical protein
MITFRQPPLRCISGAVRSLRVSKKSRKRGTVVSKRRTSWQQIIIAQTSFLEYERKRLYPNDHQNGIAGQELRASANACHASDAAKKHLDEARQAAGIPVRQPRAARLANVWSGALVCCAFANLHAAKVVLVDLYAEEDIQAAAPGVLARLQACLPSDDQRRRRAEALFGSQISAVPSDTRSQGWPNGEKRIQPAERGPLASGTQAGCSTGDLALRRSSLRDAMQVSYDAADEQYARVRSVRNVLITGAVLLSLLVIAVCLVGARYPKAIPLCSSPSSTTAAAAANAPRIVCPTSEMAATSAPRAGDVGVIALMGVLGAALSATLAVQKLRGTAAPYAVPVALAFFKLPAGALTAIAGLVLIKGDFVPGFSQLDSQGQILAYAIVFGVAQHLVTRFVDQRADDVVSSLPSKERPATGPKQASQAAQSAGGENPASTVAA